MSAGAHLSRWRTGLATGLLALVFIAVVAAGLQPDSPFERAGAPSAGSNPATTTPTADERRIERAFGKLPLAFVENGGQTDRRVSHLAKGAGFGFFFTKQKAVLSFTKDRREQVLDMRFVGANPDPQIVGAREAAGKVSYVRGAGSQGGLRTFGELRYGELWPGIDMVFRGRGGGLEYEFEIAPGADVSDIRLAYDGARDLELASSGRLLIRTALGTLTDHAPVSYQRADGRRRALDTRFVLGSGTTFGFAVPGYDSQKALLIDPRLAYSTYLGGADTGDGSEFDGDGTTAIAADAEGNAYVTGYARTIDFPTTAGAFETDPTGFDGFVTKFDPTGSRLVYSTFLRASITGIEVDDAGHAFVTGRAGEAFSTTPGAFDTTSNGAPDAFVAKLNAAGSALVYSTFIGGMGEDEATDIAIDTAGNAYISGTTHAPDFPTTPGALDRDVGDHGGDAFVSKLNPLGTDLVYSTYLGNSARDASAAIAIDGAGSAYVAGETHSRFVGVSSDFPTTPGAFQTSPTGAIFVTKLDPAGTTLAYSTFLGASTWDDVHDIAVEAAGNAFVTGNASAGFPTTPGAYDTASGGGFLTKLNPSGSALAFSTFLGGSGSASASGLALDPTGGTWIVGTTSTFEPIAVTPGVVYPTGGGHSDGYAMRLNDAGTAVLYATYLGSEVDDFAHSVAVDGSGNVYVAGRADNLSYADVEPVGTEGSFDPRFTGIFDGFIAKITVAPAPTTLSLGPATATPGLEAEHCLAATALAPGSAPSPNIAVRFAVTGVNTRARTKATGIDGQAEYCYSGTAEGADTISAYADTNRSGARDPDEPGATAAADWIARTTDPSTIEVDGDDVAPDADGCGGGPGQAADPCNTVQAGVDEARPGDTVAVATSATQYVEEVVVDKAALELLGPNDGTAAYDRPLEPAFDDEAILKATAQANAAVTVTAPEVVISGFTFQGTYTPSRPQTPVIDIQGADAAVLDTLIRDNGAGIRVSASGAFVSGNAFHGNDPYDSSAAAIAADADISNVEVFDNVFDDNGNTAVSLRGVAGVVLEGNAMLSPGAGRYQDQMILDRVSDALVRENAVIGADEYALRALGVDGLEVSGNLFADAAGGGLGFARSDTVPNRRVVVSGNALIANGDRTSSHGAIELWPEAFADSLKVVANHFFDNYWSSYPIGIWVHSPPGPLPVDAENNWWGCNEGPFHGLDLDQLCDSIYGPGVDTDPWLSFSLGASPAELQAPGAATLTAGLLTNSDGAAPPEAASIPEGLVQVEEVAGVGTLSAPEIITFAGTGTATLSSTTPGTAEVHALFDYAEATASVVFKGPPARAAPVATRDVTAPVMSGTSVTPRTFAVNPFGAAERLLRKRAGMGTVFGYKVSESSTVTFSIERILRGRRVGGKCRPATKRNRGRRRCTRYRAAGEFSVQAKAGVNSKSFSGKIGSKSLRPGRYRALIAASDAAGNRSKPHALSFRVVRR